MSPGDTDQPGVPDGLVRLSGDALAALAGLGRDDGAPPHQEALAELAGVGATDAAGRVTPPWRPIADTLAAPVGRVRLLQREGTRARRADGWVAAAAAVLAVRDGDRGRVLTAVPGGELPALLARLVELAPRSGPPADGPLRLSREQLAATVGGSPPVASSSPPAAEPLRRWRAQWRVAVAWDSGTGGVARDGCDVIDTPEGLWLVEPAGDDEVVCGPATPELVWRRLLSLLPAPEPQPAVTGWRPCRRPELGLRLDVPEAWPVARSRPGWFAVAEPRPAAPGGVPTTAQVGLAPPATDDPAAGADAALAGLRRDLPDVWLLDTADDELAGRPARRHLYHHRADGGAGVVTVAWAACELDEPTYVAVGTSATPRFLTELDHLIGVAASVGVTDR